MYIIELNSIAEFVGPFKTETEAYKYADRYFGELNSDEFTVWLLNKPLTE